MNVVDARVTPGTFAGDSASTKSHCTKQELFDSDIDGSKRMSIRVADNTAVSTEGVGRIGVLRDVNYTPKFGTNLLSVAELCDISYTVIFEKQCWRIVDAVTFNLKGERIRVGNLFWIDRKELKPPDIACSVVDCVVSGGVYAALNQLAILSKLGLVDSLKLNKSDVYPSLSMCNACALPKMTRRQFRDGNVNVLCLMLKVL